MAEQVPPSPPEEEPKAESQVAEPKPAEGEKAEPPAAAAKAKPKGAEAPGKAPEPEPIPEPETPAPPLPEGKHYIWGTGRRKMAVARVRIRPGTGQFVVNKREANDYFQHPRDREAIRSPLHLASMVRGWDVWVNVVGGGYTGQAGAVVLGLARALSRAMPEVESTLRDHGLLTRDARMKERKKPGQPGARKRFQFSKR